MRLETDALASPLTEGGEAGDMVGLNYTQDNADYQSTGGPPVLLLVILVMLVATFVVTIIETAGIRHIVQGAAYTLHRVMCNVKGVDERIRATGTRQAALQNQLTHTVGIVERLVNVMMYQREEGKKTAEFLARSLDMQDEANQKVKGLVMCLTARINKIDDDRSVIQKKLEKSRRDYYTVSVIPYLMGAEGKTPAERLRNAVFGKYTFPEIDPVKLKQLLGCPTPPGFVLDKVGMDEFISEYLPGTRPSGSASYCWHLDSLHKLKELGHDQLVDKLRSSELQLFRWHDEFGTLAQAIKAGTVAPGTLLASTEALPSQSPKAESLGSHEEEDKDGETRAEMATQESVIQSLRDQLQSESKPMNAEDDEQLKKCLEDLRQSKPFVTSEEEHRLKRIFLTTRIAYRYPLVESNPIKWDSGPDVELSGEDIGRIVQDLANHHCGAGTITMAPYKVCREIFSTRKSLGALEAYHRERVYESYIWINQKYGKVIGNLLAPRQLRPLQYPYCHIPEKYRDRMQIPWKEFEHGGLYHGTTMVSYDFLPAANPTNNNLTVQSMLIEIADLDEELEMEQLQGSPRWLDFCGRAPDPRHDDVTPRTDRLVMSPALRSLLPMFRDFFTTDQACDCRRIHIPNQKCVACDRHCLCPRHCRHCAAACDLQIETFARDTELIIETPEMVHDILYHQLVYLQELPAAQDVKYPCERDHTDVADLVTTRRRFASQLMSENALKRFNLAGHCLGHGCVAEEHLVLRNKIGPKCNFPGTATFLDAQQVESFEDMEQVREDDGYLLTFYDCPPERTHKQAIEEANTSPETGFGRANRGCTANDNLDKPVVEPVDYVNLHKFRAPTQWREPVHRDLVDDPHLAPVDRLAGEYLQGVHVLTERAPGALAEPLPGQEGRFVYVQPHPIDQSAGPSRRYNLPSVPRDVPPRRPVPTVQYHSGTRDKPRMRHFLDLIHHSIYYNNHQEASVQ